MHEFYEKQAAKKNFNVVKLITLGDGAVGKTCMLISYYSGSFPKRFAPAVMGTLNA